jgi:hypothetical protein
MKYLQVFLPLVAAVAVEKVLGATAMVVVVEVGAKFLHFLVNFQLIAH